YLSYFPSSFTQSPPAAEPRPPAKPPEEIGRIVPENQNVPFDMRELIERLVDEGSFFEIKALFAQEIITGLARLGGRVVGIVANQPKVKGGVLFVDSADKAARFIWLCDAFNIPLLFLADVPGFMIGSRVERQGIIRHGAKMIAAVSEATVPKISVIVRKAYGAGLYAMAGPGFEPDACLALPTAQIAVMGPEAAVNAVYYNRIMELEGEERQRFVEEKRREYARDIDIYRLASELVVDDIVPPERLREELIARFSAYEGKVRDWPAKHHSVPPV
ncbi:MAG TPA: carboxyl transferase domain-containing protein, partial [Thermaerobacter sp.]